MTELAPPQISSLMEALPGIAAVLRSPVATAIISLSRASAELEPFQLSHAEELLRYGVRRTLLSQDEVDKVLVELREFASKQPPRVVVVVEKVVKEVPTPKHVLAHMARVQAAAKLAPTPAPAAAKLVTKPPAKTVAAAKAPTKPPPKPAAKLPVKPTAKGKGKVPATRPAKVIAKPAARKPAPAAKKSAAKKVVPAKKTVPTRKPGKR